MEKIRKKCRKVAFITLGCKVNQYETNAMAQELIEKGYRVVEENQEADIVIINTCTVTNMSDRKSRQMLRKVKDKNKETIVVAVGCYAQVSKEELEKIEEIDLILGNKEKKDISKHISKAFKHHLNKQAFMPNLNNTHLTSSNGRLIKKKQIEIGDIMEEKEFQDFGNITYTEKTRAVIKVQDGCDRYCSYCIIPYARGKVRSRKPESIISEITKIAKTGIKEVVITGIHVASYGKDFKEEYKLIDLLEEINKIEEIKRIRLRVNRTIMDK